MKRFRKPKPLSRRKRQSVPVVAGSPEIIAGFPEFSQKVHDAYRAFFKAADDLLPLVNEALNRPVHSRLALTERFLAAVVSNSFGALVTLALNGYGHDAVRIARGMYEAAVNATYLEQHREEIDDYLDFYWVRQERLSEYLQTHPPSDFSGVHVEKIAQIEAEFTKVASRFKNKKGKLRDSWSAKSIRTRAEEVGLGELYPTFYSYATGIHHGDVSGLVAQSAKDDRTPILAPSLEGINDALVMGHNSVLHVLIALNKTASLGVDKEIEKARDAFMDAWSKDIG